ncbi:similar to Saccharomyces cerevisiae YFL034C-B MOB2 Activator of Cbk1p kinase [Maudiozyma saulgeensis]|uniref:CBK1 kinase activator protein MOB2 n=1 Tax=Maudiozyma saulgeensis TaxID=1789683 RepID=A0A1X7QZA9_9SACH|nr:similar to Saccharomyces cerevisiae YFL034C-B MOB2 Activator of Cbk1p kinase [Kazachstania saulgeensis]
MSFFNFKGFGRNSKKNKNQQAQSPPTAIAQPAPPNLSSIYSSPHNSNSKLSLRKNHSPKRNSQGSYPASHASHHRPSQQQQQQQLQQQHNYSTQSSSPERTQSQSQQIMFLSEPFVRTALVKGSFKTIVQLPKYVDIGEWIALNVFEFFTNLNQFYGVIAEYVTPDAYPTMNAGPHTDYLWLDANNRQVSLPASQYIDLALTWINNKVTDKNLFPTKDNIPFPQEFLRDVQRIMIQMFRIFAHIYHHHFDKIVHLSLEAHWNSFFAHFISFSKEFTIIDRKEMTPLILLIENFEKQGKIITT